ncbi:hypothetical protein KFZ68_20020 [Photobacterium damselae]|uniref:hypothetical protein n=1 Tax=Photobacterium damselae TaxID=38293 RepID=UPI0025437A63
MNSLEIASIKRDLSEQVETVFDELEQENNGLPTLEEFRARFASCVDDYLENLPISPVEHLEYRDKLEQALWVAANELEAELRQLKEES